MRKMKTPDFENMLRSGEIRLPPLDIVPVDIPFAPELDAVVDVAWGDQSCRYVVEWKNSAKPLTLRMAVEQAKRLAKSSGKGEPMVVVPYLTANKLDELLSLGVSGIDLCGNGVVQAPGRFSVYRTGQPNQYRDSEPLRSAYRGDSSLVTRALLLRSQFNSVGEILELIESRGGSLVMSTVSKVLKRLEQDLVIERLSSRAVRVIDPKRLLEQLTQSYLPAKRSATWLGQISLDTQTLLDRLQNAGNGNDVVKTGMGSATDYVTFGGEPVLECYTRLPIPELLTQLGGKASETRSFPNLRLIETKDQRVYFDAQSDLRASPLQTWLEMTSGDKRSREAAEPLKRKLLQDMGATNGR